MLFNLINREDLKELHTMKVQQIIIVVLLKLVPEIVKQVKKKMND